MLRVPVQAGEDERAIEAALGPDLAQLARARDARLTAFTEITRLPSPVAPRGAFLLEFEGGGKLKGRRLESAEHSEALARLGRRLGAGFARTLGSRGDAQLLEWVEGPSLASLELIPAAVLRGCGSLLGALHRIDFAEFEAGDPAAPALPRSADAFEKLGRDADIVSGARVLDPGLIRSALAAATESRPRETALGIIHKDFCAENLVLSAAGSPVCIDNAGLSVGPLDLDLARTWYRWPMDPPSRALFVEGYRAHRSAAGFLEHFVYWATGVLFGSIAWRLRMRVAGVEEPIERLKSLCAYLDARAAGGDHPFWTL